MEKINKGVILLIKTIKKIISNKKFTEELNKINKNFFNLKQELHIKNELIVQFNSECGNDEIAISEYPRGKYGTSVDLSLIKNNELKNRVELKYQYPRGLRCKGVQRELLKDTNTLKGGYYCTDFILIIHKRFFDKKGTYAISGVEAIYPDWNDNFSEKHLSEFENGINRSFDRNVISVEASEPYKNIYHFIFYHFKSSAK